MLSKLILLNSAKFSKAILDFDKDLKTVQLVGGNRFGKTSLLNSLNFLFVSDSRQLANLFGDHTLQQTLNYYFPTDSKSFILYEMYKNRFFTIIAKTDNGKISYYKYDKAYEDKHFFDENNKLRTFKEIQVYFLTTGIVLEGIGSGQDYLNFAYKREKVNNCVVWLEKTVKFNGSNNAFTEMYKCLVKPKLINNDTLKEALIAADNKNEKYDLEFSKSKEGDLLSLQRHLGDVNRIKAIKDEFLLFKKIVDDYNSKQNIISELFGVFSNLYENEISQIEFRLKDCFIQIQILENNLKNTLRPQEKQFISDEATKKEKLWNCENEQRKLKNQLEVIGKIEPKQFLELQLENLDKERADKEFELTKIEKESITLEGNTYKINTTNKEIENLKNDISGNSDKLIQHISSDEYTKQILNRILTDEVKRLPKNCVLIPISSISESFKISDGIINIKNLVPLEFDTLEILNEKLENLQNKLANFEITQKIIKDHNQFTIELQDIKTNITITTDKLGLIKQEQSIRDDLAKAIANYKNLSIDIKEISKNIDITGTSIIGETEKIKLYETTEAENRNRKKNLIDAYDEFKSKQILSKSIQSERTDINNVIKELNNRIGELENLRYRKNERLTDLQKRSGKSLTEELFIKEIEEDIITLEQKEDSINGLLQNIAEQFSNPADRLLQGFQGFQDVFIRTFNTKLSQIKISDIEEIKLIIKPTSELIKDIQTLREIRELQPTDLFYNNNNNRDGLSLLRTWLTNEKKILFHELFDIEAQIIVNGKSRKIDFSKEIESGGTSRMLKFIIFLSIIKKLIINSHDNRIPFCIDETLMIDTKNQEEMIRFCIKNHFLPIFAAPEPVKSNIDRMYYLMPNDKGDKMFVINAKQK